MSLYAGRTITKKTFKSMGYKPTNEIISTTQSLNIVNKKKNYILIALSAALGGLLFGYATAVISGATITLTQ